MKRRTSGPSLPGEALRRAAAAWLKDHPGDPRPTLVAHGAPMLVPAARTMPLEEAVAKSLLLLSEDPTVLCSLPVVLDHFEHAVAPEALREWARRLGVAPELGMVLDLTSELTTRPSFRAWAHELPRHEGTPRYLSTDQNLSRLAKRLTNERTPAVVARWGFRVNMPASDFEAFFRKHRV